MKNELTKIYLAWDEDQNRGIHGTERQVTFNELASSIVSLGPYYYYVVDFTDMTLSNVHPAVADILGFDPNTMQFTDVLEAIHPDDVEFVADMERYAGAFFHQHIPPHKLMRYKSSYNFRLRLKDGSYGLFNHQALMLTLGPDGGFGKAMNIHTRIDHITGKNTKQLSVVGLDGEPSFLNIQMDVPENQTLQFSRREIEVIKNLSDGLDSADVALKMFISPHTVNKHRKNILEKSGCKNVAQLIKMCVMQGLV